MNPESKFPWTHIWLGMCNDEGLLSRSEAYGECLVGHSRIVKGHNWTLYKMDQNTWEIISREVIQEGKTL